jgi:multidrug resistance protein, MATE family
MTAQMVGTILHALWCYIFVIKLNYGVAGAGIAMTTTYLVQYLVIIIYAYCLPQISQALSCPGKQSFVGWGEYLAISLPATLMICAEWWCFEILALLAGYIGVVD